MAKEQENELWQKKLRERIKVAFNNLAEEMKECIRRRECDFVLLNDGILYLVREG